MMLELLRHTRTAIKTEERAALAELGRSTARTLAIGGVSIFWCLALGYATGTRSKLAVTLTGVLALAGSAATLASISDWANDAEDYLHLNSGKTRAKWRETMFEAEAQRYTNHWTVLKGPAGQPQALPEPVAVAQQPQPMTGHALAKTPRSTIIVGQPGAGKGLLVADALSHMRLEHPEVSIWAVPVKDDPGEAHRWANADQLFSDPLPVFAGADQLELWKSGLDRFLEAFAAHQGPKLLGLDEALAVKESTGRWFKGLMANLNQLASTGRSKQCYAWLISQTANASDFGISAGARNVFRRVMLVSQEDQGLLLNKTTFAPLPDEAPYLFSHTGRIAFDSLGGSWAPLAYLDEAPRPRHTQLERAYQVSELLEAMAGRGCLTLTQITAIAGGDVSETVHSLTNSGQLRQVGNCFTVVSPEN